jgi:hypothetical protein
MAEVDGTAVLLFALVTEAVGRATAALLEQDVTLAENVIAGDKAIDQRCDELTGMIKEGLATAAQDPIRGARPGRSPRGPGRSTRNRCGSRRSAGWRR